MQYKLTTVHAVIVKIIRDLGLEDREIRWQDFIEVISEGMQHIGAYNQYEEKTFVVELENGRGKLPCDFYRITEAHSFRYKLVDDTIIADTNKSSVTITYLAFKLDEQGFPLIPDNVSYFDALFWKVACYLAMRDELPNKTFNYDYCRGKWNFYCRQARAKLNELSEQEKALFARSFLTLSPDINQYGKNFRDIK